MIFYKVVDNMKSHYTLKSIQITHSFSIPYVPYENSVVESFFASLKRDELYRTKYRPESEYMLSASNYMDFSIQKDRTGNYSIELPNKKHNYA